MRRATSRKGSGSMYKTAAMPAEQSRESTGKKALVPLSRYEQALFRRDMSQHISTWGTCYRDVAGATTMQTDRRTPRSVTSAAICLHPRGSCHVARKGTQTAVTCHAERALARSDSAAPRLSCLSTLGIAQPARQPSCTCCRYLSSTWHVSPSPLTHPVLSLRVSRRWSHGYLCLHGSSCGGGVLFGF